jgi:O-antigen/teichoic acid export membrane protein
VLNNLRLKPSDIFNNDFQSQGLRHTVVRGSLALVFSQGMGFGLSMLNTLILARLLMPSDFGIIGMVTVFINFLEMFKDAGLSVATIQNERINKQQISALFWINAIISLVLGITILVASPVVAIFYKKPELTAVTAVLSISFIMQGLSIQHFALLQRHLKFTSMAMADIISQIGSIAVAIVMALFGFRYWALVGATLARTIIRILVIFYFCPWSPGKMEKGTGVRNMLKFGGHLTISNFVGYLSRNLDSILIGRFIGAAPLGIYSRAYTLLMQPLTQIRAPLTTQSLPVLSSLKNDPIRYQSYFSKLLDISISLAMPVSVYCFLESEFLIRILLGQKWMDAVPVFKILAIAGIFVATSGAPGMVMLSHGFSKRYLRLTIIISLIVSASFIIGLPFGIKGVAVGYTIANFLIMIPLIYYGFKDTPIKIRLIFESILGPLISTSVAGLSTYLFIIIFSGETFFKHILTGLIFFVIYISLTLLRSKTRDTIRSIWDSIISKQK